jgi:hypothetical protein
MNTIAYASEWADEARAAGGDYNTVRASIQDRATKDHPTYLGIVTKIVYNDKTDRYIVHHGDGDTSKATMAAALFLKQENAHPSRTMRPTVYAHFDAEGSIDSVLLLFLSR